MSSVVLQIAINKPIRQCFAYCLPKNWAYPLPVPGMRIRVPFKNQSLVGMLLAIEHTTPDYPLKAIDEVIDSSPLLDQHSLTWLQWAANYYHHPLGEVLLGTLPKALRLGKTRPPVPIKHWIVRSPHQAEKPLRKNSKQQAIYRYILNHGPCGPEQLQAAFHSWRPALKALIDKKRVSEKIVEKPAIQYHPPTCSLNREQADLLRQLTEKTTGFSVNLLFGVTGSGKTEVYLRLTEFYLRCHYQVMLLVPEIGLTPQLLAHFNQRFKAPIALLHSGLSDGERHQAWLDAKNGRCQIIIGTRSAIFVPLKMPGLIILDEEHDTAFKQTRQFRYCARDLAIKRAAMLNIPLLLGSATPSLESLYNAKIGKFKLHHLNKRITQHSSPQIQLIDLRGTKLHSGLSKTAIQAIDTEIKQDGQALIFLNRRGFAPTLLCQQCGWLATCPHCDLRMTVHKQPAHLRCHVCSYQTRIPTHCPDCQQPAFISIGHGTERLETDLQQQFPHIGIVRVDRDSTRQKHTFEKMANAINKKQYQILIGTQMLAKGHHFPAVSTVVIADADQGLYGLDFRAQEAMAQLITQVIGRAGRGKRLGRIFIQTWHPQHHFFADLQNQSYATLADTLLKERAATGFPPYAYLALLRAKATQRPNLERFMQWAFTQSKTISQTLSLPPEILGPALAPLERKGGFFRMQLLFKSSKRHALHQLLQQLILALTNQQKGRQVRWSIDIDPYDLY